MKSVKQLLDTKQSIIISVTENISVLDALKVMTEKNISAVLVMEDEQLSGIFTERDYAAKSFCKGNHQEIRSLKK